MNDLLKSSRHENCVLMRLNFGRPTNVKNLYLYFIFFWDDWAHCGIFENGILLMYMLEGISSVANFIYAYEESQ